MATGTGTPTEEGKDLLATLQRVDTGTYLLHPPGRLPATDVGEFDPAQASLPGRILVSLGLRPAAWTTTSTSPGPGGSGSGQFVPNLDDLGRAVPGNHRSAHGPSMTQLVPAASLELGSRVLRLMPPDAGPL